MLGTIALIDELWSGVAVTGAPAIERELALSHAVYGLVAFAAPLVVAAVLEAGIALASDFVDRRRLVIAGQAGLAASLLFLAWTTSPLGLTLGLALAGTSSGVACGAAQALLLSADTGTDRALLRWTLFAAIGDVATPIVTAGAMALGLSYRAAMLAIASVVLVDCAALVRAAPPGREPAEPTEPRVRMAVALSCALKRPRLWMWLAAAASCTLLDELVVAFSALTLVREHGVREAWAAAAVVTFPLGSVVGAALGDRVVARVGARAVLVASSALTAVALACAILAASPALASVALFVVGVACAPHHALAQARAYDEMPGNPGTVQAVGQLFVIVDVAAPIAVGWIADRFGVRAAMASLALQPLVVALCALPPRRAR